MSSLEGYQREQFLLLKPDDQRRQKIIAEIANSIVKLPLGDIFWLHPPVQMEWLNYGYRGPTGQGFDMNETPFLKSFANHKSAWATGHDLTQLIQIATHNQEFLSKINKIVCFGLGSIQSALAIVDEDGYEKYIAHRSYCQYATALELASLFKQFNGGKKVQVFAQDPKITRMEINAFPKLGIQIVNPFLHQGFCLVDSNTFVLSCWMDSSEEMEEIILATTQPAGMLWTRNSARSSTANQTLHDEYFEVPCDSFNSHSITCGKIEDAAPLMDVQLFIRQPNVTAGSSQQISTS